jgi:hypothetical protein
MFNGEQRRGVTLSGGGHPDIVYEISKFLTNQEIKENENP